jgi:hypothetical protein
MSKHYYQWNIILHGRKVLKLFMNFRRFKYVIRSFCHFYSDKSSRKVSILDSKYNIFGKDNFHFIVGAFITIRKAVCNRLGYFTYYVVLH